MENIVLIIVLLICVITDLKSRKIFNAVTIPTILIGFLYYSFTNGLDGFLFSGKGFLVGLAVLFIPFLLGGIGAGDVKLLAAIGAIKGASFVFYTFLYGAIIGGLFALFMIARRNGLQSFFSRAFLSVFLFKNKKDLMFFSNSDLAPSFPYGVAIAFGTVCTYYLGGLL